MTARALNTSLLVLALASLACAGCSKDKKDDGDAAADAAADAGAADAAVADAADVDAADAAVTPLTTAVPVVRPKPTAAPDPPICVSARAARARNSPAAPGLEAQCKAAGGKL